MFKRLLQGVIQLMNRRDGDFSEEDKQYICDPAETLGIAFRNLQRLSRKVPTTYELLIKDGTLNRLIIERASVDKIRQAAMEAGMTTLPQEGIQFVFAGRTDFNQVMRVCSR